MKKYFFIVLAILSSTSFLFAQPDKAKYPEPEFSNEITYLKKDSVNILVRLEKGSSKMESKTKMGGMGGYESGYEMEGGRSTVRLNSGAGLSFIFSTSTSSVSSISLRDSIMRANGMDPSAMKGMGGDMKDPANTISLYKVETGKDKRKILMQKSPGMSPFGSKKSQSSDKFTFSVRKIRDGYWELVIDKTLSKGEYIFTMMNMGMGNMDGSTLLFAFAID
jgi:hypothetical protein